MIALQRQRVHCDYYCFIVKLYSEQKTIKVSNINYVMVYQCISFFVVDLIQYFIAMASSQYSIVKHTILPLIFKIAHKNTLTYLIKDPATTSLVLLPSPQDTRSIKDHVSKIQHQFQCRLTHTFVDKRADVGQLFDEKIVSAEEQGQLKPELIGELSICFIKAAGYRKDYHLLAATHITPTSTKFPVLFTGSALSVCSIDLESPAKPHQYMQTLNKLKYFPNEVLLFPQRKAKLDDLQFCYALEKNAFIARKIDQFKEKSNEMEDCLIPTSILQEKTMNPFLSPQKYSSLIQSTDQNASFEILRKMRRQWRQ